MNDSLLEAVSLPVGLGCNEGAKAAVDIWHALPLSVELPGPAVLRRLLPAPIVAWPGRAGLRAAAAPAPDGEESLFPGEQQLLVPRGEAGPRQADLQQARQHAHWQHNTFSYWPNWDFGENNLRLWTGDRQELIPNISGPHHCVHCRSGQEEPKTVQSV